MAADIAARAASEGPSGFSFAFKKTGCTPAGNTRLRCANASCASVLANNAAPANDAVRRKVRRLRSVMSALLSARILFQINHRGHRGRGGETKKGMDPN